MSVEQFEEMKRLMRQFEKRFFQAYVHVEFCGSLCTWGTIQYRHNMSGGPDGTVEFNNPEMCIAALRDIENRTFR
jgi:hypothetical protein